MVSSLHIDDGLDYKFLMSNLVCSLENEICMIERCNECPIEEELEQNLFDKIDSDSLRYQQWVHTDRTHMMTCEDSLHDYIEKLVA